MQVRRAIRRAIRIHVGATVQRSIIQGQLCGFAASGRASPAGEIADLLRDCSGREQAIFFFGGDSRTVYALRDRIAAGLPGLRIAGVCDADFAGSVDRAVLAHIAAARADVIVTDLPAARFRQFCAQCEMVGIDAMRINRSGGFAELAFGRRRGLSGLSGLAVAGRPHRFVVVAQAGLRFACIVLRQALYRALPQAGAGGAPAKRLQQSGRD